MRCAAVLSIGVALIAGCAGGGRMDERRSAFLGSSAEPSAVIAAELAFAREAHDKGTWTAFRHYAADDAVWPGPNWESVQTALKGVADPAQPIAWEPDRVWASCDGSYAFSTGPATNPSGRKSRFTTIWQMQDDGSYRWVLDQGFDLETDYDAPEMIAALIAECPAGPPPAAPRRAPRPTLAIRAVGRRHARLVDRAEARLQPDTGGARAPGRGDAGGVPPHLAAASTAAGQRPTACLRMTPALAELFLSAFITLFVVIDPPGCAPIYAGLTKGAGPAQRRNMAVRATVIAGVILLVFALFGEGLLGALHIELDSFRIAGGLMLFLIALDMVFEKRTQRREERAEKVAAQNAEQNAEGIEVEDISVFPMAMPMLAGPGAIASVMLLTAKAKGVEGTIVVLAALLAVLLLTLIALVAAGPLMRLFGDRVEAVITRLLGVLLAALAAQYVIDGLKSAFGI